MRKVNEKEIDPEIDTEKMMSVLKKKFRLFTKNPFEHFKKLSVFYNTIYLNSENVWILPTSKAVD